MLVVATHRLLGKAQQGREQQSIARQSKTKQSIEKQRKPYQRVAKHSEAKARTAKHAFPSKPKQNRAEHGRA